MRQYAFSYFNTATTSFSLPNIGKRYICTGVCPWSIKRVEGQWEKRNDNANNIQSERRVLLLNYRNIKKWRRWRCGSIDGKGAKERAGRKKKRIRENDRIESKKKTGVFEGHGFV